METIAHDKAGQQLSEVMNVAVQKQSPILITHEDGCSCVLIPLTLYNTLEKTSRRSPSPEK